MNIETGRFRNLTTKSHKLKWWTPSSVRDNGLKKERDRETNVVCLWFLHMYTWSSALAQWYAHAKIGVIKLKLKSS